MVNIIAGLDRKKFKPAVCVKMKGGDLDREVEKMGVPLLEFPFMVPLAPRITFLQRLHRAAALFRPYRFSIWHSFSYRDNYSEPLVAFWAGAKHWLYTKSNMGWGSRAWVIKSLFAEKIVIQNHDMKKMYAGPFLKSKPVLIQRGVNLEAFRPSPASGGLRRRLSVPEDHMLVGCVAIILPRKAQAYLIEAAARVPGVSLVLAGPELDKEYADFLKKRAVELHVETRVFFLGEISNVAEILKEIDVFALPSSSEGCPVALLEAMASGKPCVVADAPGNREVIRHGENGFTVPAHSVDDLAASIALLKHDSALRQKIGKAARASTEKDFSIEKEVALHQSLYESMMK